MNKKYVMDMVLEWAKVFPENLDKGDPKGNNAARAVAAKGGQFIVNAYFTSEEQIEQLLSDGLQPVVQGHPRIIEGNAAYGVGKFIKLKRAVSDVKTFRTKSGEETTKNFGGVPGVVNLTDGVKSKRPWSFEEDGPLGNGTQAKVQFETYVNGGGVRLLNVGVTDHVVFEGNALDEPDWVLED